MIEAFSSLPLFQRGVARSSSLANIQAVASGNAQRFRAQYVIYTLAAAFGGSVEYSV
jgi:hypothetical protein